MAKPLTPEQLAVLRAAPLAPTVGNRIRLAMALTDTALKELYAEMPPGTPYRHTSAVSLGRFTNLHINTARPFARFFGCTIDDLFPEVNTDHQQNEAA